MLRSLLMIVLAGLLPSSLLSQDDDSGPKADSSEQRSFSNEVGLGVHSFHPVVRGLIVGNPNSIPWSLQGTYKKQLKHFSLRAGVGGGFIYDNGWRNSVHLYSNAGIEKAIWKPAAFYEMNIALDLVHFYRCIKNRSADATTYAYGMGLTWGNQFFFSDRSSISLELGLFYGRWKALWNPWKDFGWGFGTEYRNFVLSYHYQF